MKRFAFVILIMLGLSLVYAQEVTPWQYVRHSALDNNGMVHVRFDGSPSILADYELYSWQNNAWQNIILTEGDALVYEALLPAQTGQLINYRLKTSMTVMNENLAMLNPAYLETDAFPPALGAMAQISDDAAGDSLMIYKPYLDLIGTWFAYSDNKLYATISNSGNNFPVMNSLTNYNMYFAGLANTATAMADSTIYAMVYTFNIPGIISPGLYKLGMNVADTTFAFQRLGNIQSQVVSGKLMLSCNISDLTADPSFGEWPPLFNSLGFMAGSLNIGINTSTMTPSFNFGDYTSPALLIFEKYSYLLTPNQPPVISNVSISDYVTHKVLQFTYTDANQDFPLYAKVQLENMGNEPEITPVVPDFTQPTTMTAILPSTGWENGTIRISDNNINFVTYNISNTAADDETMPMPAIQNVYPNPFNPAKGNLIINLATKQHKASINIYNLKGQNVYNKDFVDTDCLTWNGYADNGSALADGIYFAKIVTEKQSQTKKIIVKR